jgi:MFS family permease
MFFNVSCRLILFLNLGDLVDKTTIDRRKFLSVASVATALSASMIFFVQPGNSQHGLIFVSKIIEGLSASFIGPCLGALTLATFGPHHFDAVMASNALWGHIGSSVAAVLAGIVAYFLYPNIKFCFLVIAASALSAVFFVQFLPEGDRLMGRGFVGKGIALDEFGHVEKLKHDDTDKNDVVFEEVTQQNEETPQALSYWEVISDKRCFLLCITGFFFQ